jgi:hypothetical protein
MTIKNFLGVMCVCLLFFGGCSEKSSFHPERRKCLKELIKHLRVHSVYDKSGPLTLKRVGRDYDGGYVVAEKSLQKADALLGYGIADDPSFEEAFSNLYKKPSYGFDGGPEEVKSKNKLFTFIRECISSDQFLYQDQKSSGKVSTFGQQLDRLKLKNKKVFIKMDIEGAEYEAFPDILPHSSNVTGIVLELHFRSLENIKRAITLLSNLEKDFVLIHVHGNNACGSGFSTKGVKGKVRYMLELTYINKNLVTSFEVSKNQKHPQSIDMPNVPSLPDAEFEIQV